MKIFTPAAAVALLLLVSCTDDSNDHPEKSSEAQSNYEMYSKPGDTISEPPPQVSPGEPVPPKGKD